MKADHAMQIRAAIQADLRSRWQPHRGQAQVRYARKVLRCSFIFDQCGRKWGKTDHGLGELAEAALLPTNNAEGYYYIAPEDDQAKEIAWATGRVHKFFNPAFVKKVYETEMRVVFKNDRFLKIDGSNNWKKHEGTQPGLLVCDEFKRFKPQFWEIMEPNLSVFNAPVIFMGAPPDEVCQYTEVAEFVKELQKTTGEGYHLRQPSWMNDKVPGLLQWLTRRRDYYRKRGEVYIWEREYEALFKRGGVRRIFPMFDREKVLKSDEWFNVHVRRHAHRFNWFCIADPGTEVTAILFGAIDPDSRRIFFVDCIYQRDRNLTSAGAIWRACEPICKSWWHNLDDWYFAYDDQAAYFQVEMLNVQGAPAWSPSGKLSRSKEAGISTWKDILLAGNLFCQENLIPYFDEMDGYQTDENGKIPKGKDHLIDASRYFVIVAHYDPNIDIDEEIPEALKNDPWLHAAIKADQTIIEKDLIDDWTKDMFSDWGRSYV